MSPAYDGPTSGPPRTLTFLFTDIEGSTRRWEADRVAMAEALARHDALLRGAIEAAGGTVFKTVGDAFCAVFVDPAAALGAAVAAQWALAAADREAFEDGGADGDRAEGTDGGHGSGANPAAAAETLRVRMALHSGPAEERDGDYFGPTLNRVARLLAAGHGGQVLLSQAAEQLLRDSLPADLSLIDLGEHRLKDLGRSERIWQVAGEGLPADFPPLATLDARPNNLPVQISGIVGREAELAILREQLGGSATPEPGAPGPGGACRLLTLTGPGGTGKTRLALQAAAELLDRFADGVWLVDLSTVTEAVLVLPAIAEALGQREAPPEPLAQTLARRLQAKEMLLVLDNCEQVLDAAPALGALLAACPRLAILATSRAPLRLAGERELPLEPLALPAVGAALSPAALQRYAAAQLFVQRAVEARPDFVVTPANAAAVAEICRRLDGLPLAIELAAARVRALTPEAMLVRLSARLRILTGGARDLPLRQQTMRAAIAWSHDLLEEPDRLLLRRLSVFVGGWTLEAAEAVCAGEGLEDWEVLDGLQRLVEHSLVRRRDGQEGGLRYGMLETIHEYAVERLAEAGEVDLLRRRHLGWCAAVATAAEPGLESQAAGELLRALALEGDNLRAAMSWGLGQGEDEQRVALAVIARLDWCVYALPPTVALPIVDVAVRCADAYPDALDAARVLYLWASYRMTHCSGADPAMDAELLDTLAAADKRFVALDYLRGAAWISQDKGALKLLRGDPLGAQPYFLEALERKRAAGAPAWDLAITINWLGEAFHSAGQLEAAEEAYHRALAQRTELHTPVEAWPHLNLGQLAWERGDGLRAAMHFVAAARLAHGVEPYLGGMALAGLAGSALLLGQLRAAARWMAAARQAMVERELQPQPLAAGLWAAIEARLREALPEAELAAAAAEGARLSLDDAAAEAMAWAREATSEERAT